MMHFKIPPVGFLHFAFHASCLPPLPPVHAVARKLLPQDPWQGKQGTLPASPPVITGRPSPSLLCFCLDKPFPLEQSRVYRIMVKMVQKVPKHPTAGFRCR